MKNTRIHSHMYDFPVGDALSIDGYLMKAYDVNKFLKWFKTISLSYFIIGLLSTKMYLLKCVSLSNEICQVRPSLIDVNSN